MATLARVDLDKRALKQTQLQAREAKLKAKLAAADLNPNVDDKEAQRAAEALAVHQARTSKLLHLMRERVLSIKGNHGFTECAKLCRKFDMDDSGSIPLHAFDHTMEFLGLHLDQSELRFLVQIFDSDATGKVPYMEVVAWLHADSVRTVTSASSRRFAPLTYKKHDVKPKAEPSQGYMQAWLAKHPGSVEAAANHELQLTSPTGAVAVQESSNRLQASINEAQKRSSFGNEKKVISALEYQRVAKESAISLLREIIPAGQDQKRQLEEFWTEFDPKHDGLISWKEFCTGMKTCAIALSDSDLLELMVLFDPSALGGLEYNKFLDMFAASADAPVEGLLREFRRISVYSSHLKKKEELAEKKHVVPAAHVDSLWPSQPPKSGKTAALGTLKGGQHWAKTLPNRVPHRPRAGGCRFVHGEVDVWVQ